jgi:EAL domain-containing protein (putative c-di-GMP-specific phosphodiesterase class I)
MGNKLLYSLMLIYEFQMIGFAVVLDDFNSSFPLFALLSTASYG